MTAATTPPTAQPLRRRRAPVRGQALVEFVIAAMFFLLPLLLAVIAFGKLGEVRHTTVMAARYAAWERTVWYDGGGTKFQAINGANQKSAAEINSEIGVRLVNDRSSTTIIKSTDRSATGFANGIDPMWRDTAHRAFLDQYDQQATTLASQAPAHDFAGQAVNAIESLPLPSGVVGTLAPPVPTSTLAVADVSFSRIARNSTAFQRLWPSNGVWGQAWAGLDFRAPGAILSNTWGANGSTATRAMVAESVPTSKGLGTVVTGVADTVLTVWDPIMSKPDFGKIAPDVVPGDRLKTP